MAEPDWLNPRWQRLLMWWPWRYSPSLMRRPTFREAWTGRTSFDPDLGAAFVRGFEETERQIELATIMGEMPLGLSASLTCRCAKCHRDRDIELSRAAKGGRVLPLATQTEGGATYAAETKEACACGSKRLILRLRHRPAG